MTSESGDDDESPSYVYNMRANWSLTHLARYLEGIAETYVDKGIPGDDDEARGARQIVMNMISALPVVKATLEAVDEGRIHFEQLVIEGEEMAVTLKLGPWPYEHAVEPPPPPLDDE